MSKKILITGVSGFAGAHLLNSLVSAGDDLYGTYFAEESIKTLGINKDKIKLKRVDLTSTEEASSLIEEVAPDQIYHLAAFTSASNSFSSPKETILNNISSQINILEAVRKAGLAKSKILVISSAEVYGDVKESDLPIDENTSFNPTNPYAVSKLSQDFLGLQYFLAHNLQIVRVRPFNHIGPGQSPGFVVAAFAKKIAEIEKNSGEGILKVGNLDSKRDFTDVRDMIEAYILAMSKGVAGEVYNLGFGHSYKISDILEKLLALSKAKIKVEVDKSLLRPVDNPDLICDTTKFKKLTGWEPKIQIDVTLKDTLDYWRNII